MLQFTNHNERTGVGPVVAVAIESFDMLAGIVELIWRDSSVTIAFIIVVVIVAVL